MIRLKNLSKNYKDNVVYTDFNLDIEENKVLCILGESGSGKTTLVNMLCGLTEFTGEIEGDIADLSVVFQQDRLIPNLTVEQNIKLVNPEADVDKMLELFNLSGLNNAYPSSLSGGMARRVSIIRALCYPSKILILDEPFINLDIGRTYSIIELMQAGQKINPKTIILVTHDIKEAVTMADRIIVLKKGEIVYDNKTITPETETEIFNLLLKTTD